MYLVCITKRVFIVVCQGKKFSFSYGNLLLEIMSIMGGTPFGRQEFLVFSPPRSRAVSLVSRSSLARLSLVSCSSLARLVRLSLVLFVSRSSCSSLARLVRQTLVRLPFGLSLSMFMM